METFLAGEMGDSEVVEVVVIKAAEVVTLCVRLASRRVAEDMTLLYPTPHEYFS